MHNGTIGKIAEYRFVSEFLKQGYEVFLPVIENSPTDILRCKNRVYERIQIKCTETNNGDYFNCKCHTNNAKGEYYYTEDDFDFMGVLDLLEDAGYLLPAEKVIGKDKLRLRLTPPKNNQTVKINYAADYKIF